MVSGRGLWEWRHLHSPAGRSSRGDVMGLGRRREGLDMKVGQKVEAQRGRWKGRGGKVREP